MKTWIIVAIPALLILSSSNLLAGEKWYSTGSLHQSTVSEWKSASSSNRLATVADWALTRPSIKNKVQKSGSMDTLKPYAFALVACINEAVKDQDYDNVNTSELAAVCMITMSWEK